MVVDWLSDVIESTLQRIGASSILTGQAFLQALLHARASIVLLYALAQRHCQKSRSQPKKVVSPNPCAILTYIHCLLRPRSYWLYSLANRFWGLKDQAATATGSLFGVKLACPGPNLVEGGKHKLLSNSARKVWHFLFSLPPVCALPPLPFNCALRVARRATGPAVSPGVPL